MRLQAKGLHRPGLGPLDITVEAGHCLAVSGPSGAGKSLLLRALADLDAADGQVELDGRSRDRMPVTDWRRAVGYLAAEPGWWAPHPIDHFTDPEAALDLARKLGLDDGHLHRPIVQLSTGERQRLALVRLLLNDPAVLLLDEPTAALDRTARDRVEALVADCMGRGVAVILVSHDPEQAERLGARVLSIRDGQWVGEGAP